MKQESLGKLKNVFGYDDYVYAESEKYNYCISLYDNEVEIGNKKWKSSIYCTLTFVNGKCFLTPSNFYVPSGYKDVEIPEGIKIDVSKDFDSVFTDKYVDEICNKEIAIHEEEERKHRLEIKKATNDFFGINEGDKN